MNHLSNNSSMISSMNLRMYNMMDHIIDNYNCYWNNLHYNYMNRFLNLKCKMDSNQLLNSSDMNYYFNYDKLNMLNHRANNNYCFHNNDHHITKNKFTIFDCNLDMNHLSNNSSMTDFMNSCMYNMMDHIIDNHNNHCNTLNYNIFDKYLGQQYNKDMNY